MKKQIWHLKVEYEWNTVRSVRGVEKSSKNINKSSLVTCAVGDTVEELNKDGFLLGTIANKLKTSQKVEIRITGWEWREKMGMSNDVH